MAETTIFIHAMTSNTNILIHSIRYKKRKKIPAQENKNRENKKCLDNLKPYF
jgi:hypothetical protein